MDINSIELPATFPGFKQTWVRREDGTGYDAICGRCGGTGYYQGFTYIDGGICFNCNGQKGALQTITNDKARQLLSNQLKAAAKKEAARLAICAERDARVARLAASAPDVAAYLQAAYDKYQTDPYATKNAFIMQLAEQVHNAQGRDLSERQVEAVRNVISRNEERKVVDANRPPVVEGKQTITGTVLSTKIVDGDYGTTYKMLVETEQGFKVYGTIPMSMLEQYTLEEFKGVRVQFNATVEASRDDKSFGFFKRPTKGTVLS